MPSDDQLKPALRTTARQARDSLSANEREDAASILANSADKLLACSSVAGAQTVVSAYIAIGSELDPTPLIDVLADRRVQVALPVMTGKDQPLVFRAWAPGDDLVDRMWGIREPGSKCAQVEPDILLVPLLLADGAGYRLGYGGGFYDRTLALLRARKRVFAIGLGYATQYVDAVPRERYDQPLDALWTPDRFILY